jgi:serine/threonine protein phosphatase PrpC
MRWRQTVDSLSRSGHATSQVLLAACQEANQSIAHEIEQNTALDGMGTTLIGILCEDNKLSWISVGDSHLLLRRGRHLIKLNQDHSMRPVIKEMVVRNLISSEQAVTHPDRNALRSVLNGENVSIIDDGMEGIRLRSGDVLVVASDGIDALGSDAVTKILQSSFSNLRYLAEKIVSAAARIGGSSQDNTTVMLIRVD